MKAKKIEKKLGITRSTVANLNNLSMDRARGGATGACDSGEPVGCETESQCGPYVCPSYQPQSTCYPDCCSIDPTCIWPNKTDLFC